MRSFRVGPLFSLVPSASRRRRLLALLAVVGIAAGLVALVVGSLSAGEEDEDYSNYVNDGDFGSAWTYWTDNGNGFSMVSLSCPSPNTDCLKLASGVSGSVDQYFTVYDTGTGSLSAQFYVSGLGGFVDTVTVALLDPNETQIASVECEPFKCNNTWITKTDGSIDIVEEGTYRIKYVLPSGESDEKTILVMAGQREPVKFILN